MQYQGQTALARANGNRADRRLDSWVVYRTQNGRAEPGESDQGGTLPLTGSPELCRLTSHRGPVRGLSHCRWQWIALAQAFSSATHPFVIRDEPTAPLDPHRSKVVLCENVRILYPARPVLRISDRFSNVGSADRIHVMGVG